VATSSERCERDSLSLGRRDQGATAITELVVRLPDDLAERAKKAGLLADGAIQRLLEDTMRREAGRRLLQVAGRLHAAGVPPMSDEPKKRS
jgi:hypothetical protein